MPRARADRGEARPTGKAPRPAGKVKLGGRLLTGRLINLARQPVFIFLTLAGHAVIFLGAGAFFHVEHGTNPHVKTALDALYWAVATVTTVGYGDIAPVTAAGKVVGIGLMVTGSLFLWSYIALFTGALLAPELRELETDVREIEREVRQKLKHEGHGRDRRDI